MVKKKFCVIANYEMRENIEVEANSKKEAEQKVNKSIKKFRNPDEAGIVKSNMWSRGDFRDIDSIKEGECG